MLQRALLALALLVAALPAAGQTKLAQQCAAFGEAQYRKLSPSDQGQIRELYLASLEQVALPLRDRFFKLYAYY